jgi:tetratricopeptide (TPR) repeat protein
MAQWNGMDALSFPSHPLWGRFVRFFAGMSFPAAMAVRLNMLSLMAGVLSAGLVSLFVSFFVWQTISNEDSIKHARGASLAAGTVAAFAFIFSTAVWQASTHLDYRMFDVAMALLLFALFLPMTCWPKTTIPLSILLGFGVAAGVVESVIFFALMPVYVMALVVVNVKNDRKWYLPVFLFIMFFAIGFVMVSRSCTADWLTTQAAAAGGYETWGDALKKMGRDYTQEFVQWFKRPGWLYVFLFTVLSFVACSFAALRGLNNERRWSVYLFHIAMTLCSILALATPLAPEALMRKWGFSPVATTTLAAMVAGYLAAYWFLTLRIPLPKIEFKEDGMPLETAFGRRAAPAALGLFCAVLALSALLNVITFSRSRGKFADVCAGEILDRLGTRTWFVTDGLLDDHLRILAATRGRELNLVCLQRDMDDAYLKEFGALIKEKKLSAGRANLSMSIQLGVLPFLQDWFMGDPQVTSKAAIFGVPDFWYMAERVPAPDCFFFGGVNNAKEVDGRKAKADFDAFWAKIDPVLHAEPGQGSRSIRESKDPVESLRLQLRRHVGFVANNLGVLLQDAGFDAEAFDLYERVLAKIDPDNVCALFNEFEMARAGFKAAVARKGEIERKIRALVDDPKRRYLLWSLSRYYGYIRAPEIFARMGFAWARSGQTGNAIAQVQRAIDFVPADRQAGLLNMMAAIYASGNQAQKSRDTYAKVLAADAANHDALMGLTRLALQEGSVDEARKYLTRAVDSVKDKKDSAGVEWALLHLMNNDLSSARMAMQKVTDLQPKSLQAWSLLAGVLLQQADQEKDANAKKKIFDELENVIIPRMESVATTPRDYFVQITRALVMMRKGPTFRKAARDALVLAAASRPDVSATGDMILNLDIALDDGESAEHHARTILRRNRHDKLANYVMGSLRLKDGDYASAETFLMTSVSQSNPLGAAQNDLAEVLRRQQRYEDAEKYARGAVRTSPELYVAWETLGSVLLDTGKNLDEAENCVKKALELSKEKNNIDDIRMQITLARVQIARGDLGHARGTLRTLRSRRSELSNYDRNRLEDLLRAAKMN